MASAEAVEATRATEEARRLARHLRDWPNDRGARRRLDALVARHASRSAAAVWFERAALHQEEGDLLAAVADWERGLAQEPRSAVAWSFLAVARLAQGDPAGALAAAERALALDDEDVSARVVQGVALLALGRPIEARVCLAAAEHQDPLHPAAARHLAVACARLQRRVEALAALARASALQPGDRALSEALARASARAPALRVRADALNAALAQDAERWVNAALAAERRQARPLALAALAEALRRQADHPVARHLHDALCGAPSRQPPPGYVARLFDDYADTFEDHLVGDLGYRLPEVMAALAPPSVARAVDLGCGTGLLAPLLRHRVGHLIGVDLSPKMLARCAAGGLYDGLFLGDGVDWLSAARERDLDLVVAADVLIYVGDAAPLLAAVAGRLAPQGRLLLSVEPLAEGEGEGDGLRLQESGRYAHSDGHIRAAAQAAGLGVWAVQATPLRRGGPDRLSGWQEGAVYTLGWRGGRGRAGE